MTTASVAHAVGVGAPMVTLRSLILRRLGEGRRFSVDEAIAIIVPLCLDLKERHDRGEHVYLHPSCIAPGPDGLARLQPQLAIMPTSPRDRACVAPELQRTLAAGDARASVFSIGAILYELVTGATIGPAMRRPCEVDPEIPEALETLLAKALVGDPAHRPDDLGALASAMHHLAPMKSIPPPTADESRLDQTDSFEVDVRLSMLPPSEVAPHPHTNGIGSPPMPNIDLQDPFGNVAVAPATSRRDLTAELGTLKERLESDTRPRYVVSKDKMDHGPFSAVELLQQIASNSFSGDHGLRDEISGQSHPIKEWEEFAPFAEQAALKRELVKEKRDVARVVQEEKQAGAAKLTIGIMIVLSLVAIVGVFIYKKVGHRNDDVSIDDDKGGFAIDSTGSVKGQKHARAGGGGGGGGGGGLSFEAAWARAEQRVTIGGAAQKDLTREELAAPMANGSFLGACGTPNSMKVNVRAAVQNGRVVGVTVITTPGDPGVQGCIANAVRGVHFPASPNMDKVETNY